MNRVFKVGIGFATGRKNFQRVLKSYIYNWKESGLVDSRRVSLNLFVAYDLSYHNTLKTDYTPVSPEISSLVDSQHFIGKNEVEEAKAFLTQNRVLNGEEAESLFGKGYAAQRNIVLYRAIRSGMDCLLFLDDDEYPVAVTNTRNQAVWGGQQVLKEHLENIENADITFGHHCGYISPIPRLDFDDVLPEREFRLFIEAISNDIISWKRMKTVMANGGVTYADTRILMNKPVAEVPEVNACKFIAGSNLCINLTDPKRVFPFYNPPGARGEDTFLSTCLGARKVLRVPCYTFHDGFSGYHHLLAGVLPIELKPVAARSEQIVKRFQRACLGWIRYKPLLLYITDRAAYPQRIEEMTDQLSRTLPLLCRYFNTDEFMSVLKELRRYDVMVQKHYEQFQAVKAGWARLMRFYIQEAERPALAGAGTSPLGPAPARAGG